MRKSTTTAMIILMVCFGSLFLAANVMLEPFKQDTDFAKTLEAEFGAQGLIAPDSKLVARTLPGGKEQRLAEEAARGIAFWYEPHVDTLARPQGLESLTYRILSGLQENPPRGKLPPWVELNIQHGDEVILRRLVRVLDGAFTEIDPPLPEIWIPGMGGQDAPRKPRRGAAAGAGG